MEKILVIDDDDAIRKLIKDFLQKEGYLVETAGDAKSALSLIGREPGKYKIAILDLMLPDMSGIDVCAQIRKFSDMPIIMLTAKSEDSDKIAGLETGADDYLTKPFNPAELVARINAIIRRSYSIPPKTLAFENLKRIKPEIIKISFNKNQSLKKKVIGKITNRKEKFKKETIDIEINEDSRKITVNEEEVKLTNKEFNLLVYLVKNKNIVLSRKQLLEKIWGYDFVGESRTIDVHIKEIRKKIGDISGELIETVWAVGYRLNME